MCFSTETLDPTILDPSKRVRYATGLVLGVDEFLQDQTYLMERDQRHQRALHGYGTVHGLDVRARLRDGAAEVTVAPGVAVDAAGRDVCVPALQCARVDAWLADHADEVEAALAGSFPDGSFPDGSSPDGGASLYVVLCHRECETDAVPLPGSPCRSEDDALAPSRVADRFELRITASLPAAVEEAAVRRFGRLLRRLRVGSGAPALTPDALADLVRALPEAGEGGDEGPLYLPPAEAADLVRLAFRVWTVEVRPQLGGEGACRPPAAACVLLARLDLAVVADGDGYRLDGDAPAGPGGVPGVVVRQSGRPYLLSTRVLQEWLAHFCGCAEGPGSFPDSFPELDVVLALNDLLDVETTPADGDVLTWDADAGVWAATAPTPGGASDHGALTGLGNDDHPQYHTDARGDARYAPLGHTHSLPALTQLDAGGDLDGFYPDPTVTGIQGRSVSAIAPAADQVLRWDGAQWTPADLPAAGGTDHEEELVRIVATSWQHDEPHDFDALRLEVDGEEVRGLVVAFGFREPQDGGMAFVNDDSLDADSFQLFFEAADPDFPGDDDYYTLRGVRPGLLRDDVLTRRVFPVSLDDISSQPWQVSTTSPEEPAEAALFPLTPRAAETILGRTLRVVIHGDVVRDENGRAIDAEFVRAEAPTGDRPDGAPRGTQGGRFESWFLYGQPRINVNTATREELLTLEGVGPARVRRLLEARAGGAVFRSADDLVELGGLPEVVVEALADRLRFRS